jgi:ribosomal protein L11 methylase PrmA
VFDYAGLPKDRKLLIDIDSAAKRLFNKLKAININTLDTSDYNKSYFGGHISNLTYRLQLYSYILSWSLAKSNVPYNKFVFMDYGGGSGTLSLLARELGIGTVIYTDIYDVSCRDAKFIAESIGNRANHYVCGDIDQVINFLKANSIYCNAIASYDVIEHIYDIEAFFNKLQLVPGKQLRIVMSSGANTFNPGIRKAEMEKQLDVEYKNREKIWGHKERDCLRAYLEVRREMILKHLHKLNKELAKSEVDRLARDTRGLIEGDIEKCIDEYLKTGKFPKAPSHPTNTCDPYTGNWMEHLMDPYKLVAILSKIGFKAEILSGFYRPSKNIAKRFCKRLLTSYLFKKQGLKFAAFYTVYARRDY